MYVWVSVSPPPLCYLKKKKNAEAVSFHQQQTSPAPKSLFLWDISSQEILELLGEMANSKVGIVIKKKNTHTIKKNYIKEKNLTQDTPRTFYTVERKKPWSKTNGGFYQKGTETAWRIFHWPIWEQI